MNSYLWDTNTVIDYLKGSMPSTALDKLDTIVDEERRVSVITQIEVLGWKNATIEQLETPQNFMNGAVVLGLSNVVVKQTINIRLVKGIKLPDAIIAATAISNGLKLISRNLSDFSGIPNLIVVNPYDW